MLLVGNNRSTNDTAFLSEAIAVDDVTTTTLRAATTNENERIYFSITVLGRSIWLKFQAASVDDDKIGIFVPRDGYYEMPINNIYTGEISAICDNGTANVYVTEY